MLEIEEICIYISFIKIHSEKKQRLRFGIQILLEVGEYVSSGLGQGTLCVSRCSAVAFPLPLLDIIMYFNMARKANQEFKFSQTFHRCTYMYNDVFSHQRSSFLSVFYLLPSYKKLHRDLLTFKFLTIPSYLVARAMIRQNYIFCLLH